MHQDPVLREFYKDPRTYELDIGYQPDLDFWISQIHAHGAKTLLELCCGCGRLGAQIMPMLERYDGVDLSDEYLHYFSHKIQGIKAELRLVCSDARTVRTGRK